LSIVYSSSGSINGLISSNFRCLAYPKCFAYDRGGDVLAQAPQISLEAVENYPDPIDAGSKGYYEESFQWQYALSAGLRFLLIAKS
jgi:hypothetical protein